MSDRRVDVYMVNFSNTLNDYKKYLPDGVGNIIYNEAYTAVKNAIADFDEIKESKNKGGKKK